MTALNSGGPTPYEDVNNVLQVMLRDVQAILGPQLVAFYLYGSLSLGDFDPASSDIDFLIVTAGALSEAALDRLRVMHADIDASGLPYASRLEGSYIPRAALRRYDPRNAHHPTIGSDWSFHIEWHGYNWVIERHIVREHGVVVWGPPPGTLIDPVSPQELRGDGIDQRARRRSPHDDTMFAHDMALDHPVVAVPFDMERPIRADGRMVRVPRIVAPQRRARNVGAFESAGVGKAARIDVRVHDAQAIQRCLR